MTEYSCPLTKMKIQLLRKKKCYLKYNYKYYKKYKNKNNKTLTVTEI